MKICHLITSIDRGGAENHLISLIKEQNKNSEILLIYLRGNNYWKKELETLGVKVIKIDLLKLINITKFIKAYFELKKAIFNFNPKIVHAHLSSMELLSSLLKFFNPKKVNLVVTKHLDSHFLEGSFGQNLLIRGVFIDKFILKNTDKIICISKQVKKYFTKKISIPKNKIRVIYYGVDRDYFTKKKNFRKTKVAKLINKNLEKKDFLICCIARHVKQKSLDFLILSFAEFTKKNPNSKLLLIGDGPERKNLVKISKENNIFNKIIWVKFSEHIKDLLNISNVFVLPSKYEGFGIVFLEAMLTNTPVISTNISAIPEIIKNKYNGILIEPGNVKQMTAALKNIQDEKLIKKFNINAKKLLSNKFNLKMMFKKTNNIYCSI
jgi:glycosyltransferase involved in cell wall biosynthesis